MGDPDLANPQLLEHHPQLRNLASPVCRHLAGIWSLGFSWRFSESCLENITECHRLYLKVPQHRGRDFRTQVTGKGSVSLSRRHIKITSIWQVTGAAPEATTGGQIRTSRLLPPRLDMPSPIRLSQPMDSRSIQAEERRPQRRHWTSC